MNHDPPITPNRRGVLIAATTLPVCLVILIALPSTGPQAPCSDTRPEDVGRPVPDQLAPLLPPDTPHCAMTAGLTRIDLPMGDAPLSTHVTALDARMQRAGWARCEGDPNASPERGISRCFVMDALRLDLTAHVSTGDPPALVLHATVEPARAP